LRDSYKIRRVDFVVGAGDVWVGVRSSTREISRRARSAHLLEMTMLVLIQRAAHPIRRLVKGLELRRPSCYPTRSVIPTER